MEIWAFITRQSTRAAPSGWFCWKELLCDNLFSSGDTMGTMNRRHVIHPDSGDHMKKFILSSWALLGISYRNHLSGKHDFENMTRGHQGELHHENGFAGENNTWGTGFPQPSAIGPRCYDILNPESDKN